MDRPSRTQGKALKQEQCYICLDGVGTVEDKIVQGAPVPNSVLNKLQEPSVVDGIEKATDVCVEHPGHLPLCNPDYDSIQRMVLAAAGSEAVTRLRKGRVQHRVQHLERRLLHQSVHYRRDAQLPHPTAASASPADPAFARKLLLLY